MRRLSLLALLLGCSAAAAGPAADQHVLTVLRLPSRPTETAGPSKRQLTEEQMVRELYVWSLARMPTDKELSVAVEFVKSYGTDRTGAAQDLMWVLINRKNLPIM
ncbi:MAG TPA: hypothetical protein VM597_26650 [Gemmataceae bacterium]|jgi:hypothetical protein|nr:hypothetical protein [Gemmataceae bacterium]